MARRSKNEKKASPLKRAVRAFVAFPDKPAGLISRRPAIGRAGTVTAVSLVALLLFMGLFYVWTRMKLVQIGYEIASLEKKNNALKNRKRELLLEIASLQSPGRLERQARKKLGLVFPTIGKVVHVP
jgi:cell division protein FtsL